MAIKGGLKMADSLTMRGIQVDKICALCHCFDETTTHLFFECDYSFSILSILMRNLGFLLLRPNILQIFEYIEDTHHMDKNFYFLLICCAVYYIWRERNDRKFGGNSVSCTTLTHNIKTVVLLKFLKWKNAENLLHLL
ncbi:hypothetical protein MA16_Dca015299 [Dendrobium catenatum]|uniref:Reverse transcriptase zinc-binding domain-containing protein n=1 Tax=Dendrobium catenatum TaxID=906689 RepID=A0A2I0X038_9ASPA|nr:hypothetical protein MA16_Dca015299 [Dendrobium catenatum]